MFRWGNNNLFEEYFSRLSYFQRLSRVNILSHYRSIIALLFLWLSPSLRVVNGSLAYRPAHQVNRLHWLLTATLALTVIIVVVVIEGASSSSAKIELVRVNYHFKASCLQLIDCFHFSSFFRSFDYFLYGETRSWHPTLWLLRRSFSHWEYYTLIVCVVNVWSGEVAEIVHLIF